MGRREMRSRYEQLVLPLIIAGLFLLIWHFAVKLSGNSIFPTPFRVLTGMIELARKGVLVKYVVASLFRVASGFLLALIVRIPLGLLIGWHRHKYKAINTSIQVF